MPPRSRQKPSSATQNVAQYLHWRAKELEAKSNKAKFRKNGNLDDLVTTAGEELSDGSFIYYLDPPVPLDNGKTVLALEKHRSVTVFMDEEAAERLAEELDIIEDVSYMERVWDEDAFYVMNQKGVISDDQLDALLVENEEFSLQVVTE